jgi:hypothetical protein
MYKEMSMMIQGPKHKHQYVHWDVERGPSHFIGWDAPTNSWDAVTQDYFPMRAALITTAQEYRTTVELIGDGLLLLLIFIKMYTRVSLSSKEDLAMLWDTLANTWDAVAQVISL